MKFASEQVVSFNSCKCHNYMATPCRWLPWSLYVVISMASLYVSDFHVSSNLVISMSPLCGCFLCPPPIWVISVPPSMWVIDMPPHWWFLCTPQCGQFLCPLYAGDYYAPLCGWLLCPPLVISMPPPPSMWAISMPLYVGDIYGPPLCGWSVGSFMWVISIFICLEISSWKWAMRIILIYENITVIKTYSTLSIIYEN